MQTKLDTVHWVKNDPVTINNIDFWCLQRLSTGYLATFFTCVESVVGSELIKRKLNLSSNCPEECKNKRVIKKNYTFKSCLVFASRSAKNGAAEHFLWLLFWSYLQSWTSHSRFYFCRQMLSFTCQISNLQASPLKS